MGDVHESVTLPAAVRAALRRKFGRVAPVVKPIARLAGGGRRSRRAEFRWGQPLARFRGLGAPPPFCRYRAFWDRLRAIQSVSIS